MMRRRIVLPLIAAIASVLTCGSVASAQALPPYAAAYEPTTVDERGIWMEADEQERRLRDSPLVMRDEALNAHVRRVLCRAVGDDRCKAVRIYILEVPAPNASMRPNGMMEVWSGLLLRTRSEAELGSILGHEFAHFELRHSLKDYKQRRTTSDIVAWASVLGGLASTNTSMLQVSLLGSSYRYGRDQEEAADALGLQYLAASPYPAMAASELWQHLMAEADATAIGRKRKASQRYAAGIFDSHPTHLKRSLTLGLAAAKLKDDGEPAAASHRAALAGHFPRLLGGQVALNDFGGTEYLLGQLAANGGWNGDLLFARGELFRMRGQPRDLVTAAGLYGDAIKSGYVAPEAHRNLGLSLLRSGMATDGKSSLNEYLRLKPDAPDAAIIKTMLTN